MPLSRQGSRRLPVSWAGRNLLRKITANSACSSGPILMDMEIEGARFDAGPFINKYLRYIYFTFAFLVAIPNYFLFRKETGYNYAEQAIAAMFILGFLNTVYLLLIWLPFLSMYPINLTCLLLLGLFTGLVFYRGKWWLTLLKTLVSVVGSLLLFLLAIFLLWAVGLAIHTLRN